MANRAVRNCERPSRGATMRNPMDTLPRTDLFHGLFELRTPASGRPRLSSTAAAPRAIPDPQTGRP